VERSPYPARRTLGLGAHQGPGKEPHHLTELILARLLGIVVISVLVVSFV